MKGEGGVSSFNVRRVPFGSSSNPHEFLTSSFSPRLCYAPPEEDVGGSDSDSDDELRPLSQFRWGEGHFPPFDPNNCPEYDGPRE